MTNRRQVTYSTRPNHAARAAHARGDKMFRSYDVSAIEPRKSKGPVIFGVVLVLVVIAGLIFFATTFLKGCSSDADLLPSDQSAQIVVADGSGAQAIASSLKEAHLISDTSAFTKRVAELGVDTQLKPGTYTIKGGTTVDEIINTLKKGVGATGTQLVIPEGFTIARTAAAVETATKGSVTAASFTAAASDASKVAANYDFLVEVGTKSLEGFLFPKTYSLSGSETAEDIICMMLDQFKKEVVSLDLSVPGAAGLSYYDMVKLASIIEKESTNETRAMVSSVFYNRLAIGMALQSDATTAYYVGHDPTAEEVHANNEWSTYTNPGLPPTPICSPGLASLKAACAPDDTDYMYFYFKKVDGKTQYFFSETYDEHQSAIAG